MSIYFEKLHLEKKLRYTEMFQRLNEIVNQEIVFFDIIFINF